MSTQQLLPENSGIKGISKMRRSPVWMMPVVLLLTAMGSTAAHADTLECGATTCSPGEYVTEIAGLKIDGSLYNVTFGDNPDTTFANGEAVAEDAAAQIAIALQLANGGSYGIVSPTTNPSLGTQAYCVDQGGDICYITIDVPGLGWRPLTTDSDTLEVFDTDFLDSGGAYYAEFSPAVATPEPGTAMFTLAGLGMIGLLVVLRRRVA
jgi:hypothetical protein